MSSHLFSFHDSFYPDPLVDPPFGPNPFQEIQNHDPFQETGSLDRLESILLPTGAQVDNLLLSPPEKTESAVKTEEYQLGLYGFENGVSPEGAVRFVQSFCSSFGKKQDFSVWPRFKSAQESPENAFSGGLQTRRVSSTGDLQKADSNVEESELRASTGKPLMEDSNLNLRVGRYSAEEKKERIDRYRAKRTQRNFNKTIKYACRKTLADSRPRVRGRFVRNDEAGEIAKEEKDVWTEGFEDDNGIDQSQMFFNIVDSTQYHNYIASDAFNLL